MHRDEHIPLLQTSSDIGKGKRSPRVLQLDAWRGILCLIVTFHHWELGCWPHLDVCMNRYIHRFLSNGHWAVCGFFVLSGISLSWKYFHSGGLRDLLGSAVFRPTRLALPLLCAGLLSWILARRGAYGKVEAVQAFAGSDWCGRGAENVCYTKSLVDTIRGSMQFLWTFRTPSYPGGVLWTIPHEFMGSLFVYLMAPILHMSASSTFMASENLLGEDVLMISWGMCFVCMILLHMATLWLLIRCMENDIKPQQGGLLGSWFHVGEEDRQVWRTLVCFQVGMVIAQLHGLWSSSETPKVPLNMVSNRGTLLQMYALPCLASLSIMFGLGSSCGFYLDVGLSDMDMWIVGHTMICIGLLLTPWDKLGYHCQCSVEAFSTLGLVSFGAYLLHGIVLYAFVMPIYISLVPKLSTQVAFGLSSLLGMFVLMVGSHLFYTYVDKPITQLRHLDWGGQ